MAHSLKAFSRSYGIERVEKFLRLGVRIHRLDVVQDRLYIEYESIPPEICTTRIRYVDDGISDSIPNAVNKIIENEKNINVHWGVSYNTEKRVTWFVVTWEEP